MKKLRMTKSKDVFENKPIIKLIRTKPQMAIIKTLNRRLGWSNFRSPVILEKI